MLKVQKTKCDQCLFSKNRIVPEERATEIVKTSLKKGTYFNCHKTQLKGLENDVCCRGFWDAHKDNFNLGRIAQRLGVVKEITVK